MTTRKKNESKWRDRAGFALVFAIFVGIPALIEVSKEFTRDFGYSWHRERLSQARAQATAFAERDPECAPGRVEVEDGAERNHHTRVRIFCAGYDDIRGPLNDAIRRLMRDSAASGIA